MDFVGLEVATVGAPSSGDSGYGEKASAGSKPQRACKTVTTVATVTTGSAPPADKGKAPAEKRPYTQREGNGRKDIGDILGMPWDEDSRKFMSRSKRVAIEQLEKYKGSYDKALYKFSDVMTFPKLVSTLMDGLTDEDDQFAVVPGEVFFKRGKLKTLKEWYNKNAKYNPIDIGVELDKTQVKIEDVVYTVESVEAGMYKLAGCDIKIDQWKLLECRCTKDDEDDNGVVTLEKDLQKYILSLITIHTIIWTSFVPYLMHGQNIKKGTKNVGTTGMMQDWSKRELSIEEKDTLEGVAKMRRLSKLAFVNASVEDTLHTLPVKATDEGHTGHEEVATLRAFAGEKGSLSKLNFQGGLIGADKTSIDLMDSNDSKLIILMSAKKGESLHGSYPAAINHATRLLQYTYRLNRPISIHEAYHPMCAAERDILREHFNCWDDNEDEEDDYIISPISISGSGDRDKTYAMRFALERCGEIIPVMPPTMIEILSRDPEKYGTVADNGKHENTTAKAAKAFDVLKFVMDQDMDKKRGQKTEGSLIEMFGHVKYLLCDKRIAVGVQEAKSSRMRGVSTKRKKGRMRFVTFSNKENLIMIKYLYEGLYRNGWMGLMKAIREIDEMCAGRGGWCYDILKSAEVIATDTRKNAVITEDHLRGNVKQSLLITKMVEGLKDKGITGMDFEIASAATSVRDMHSSAPLRPQGFFHRILVTCRVENLQESRNPGRMVIGLPFKSKVSGHGQGSGNGAAQEHVIDVDCADWYAILVIIGRPFMRSFYHDNSITPESIGPLEKRGNEMSEGRFDGVVKKIGRAYLHVQNMSLNTLRSSCGTNVMAECTALGIPMDAVCVKDYASSTLSSVKMMQKHYDAHRATTKQSRCTQRNYEGVVDFSGGIQGILEGMERRRVEGGDNEKGEGRTCTMEGSTGDDRDRVIQELQRQLKERDVQDQLRDLRQENELLKARLVGTPQSQAGGSTLCATDAHEAGVRREPANPQDMKPRRKRNKKVYVFPEGAREGMLVILDAIKAAHARARLRGSCDEVLKRLDLPRVQNGHYGMVGYLLKHDKEFKVGDWYMNSCYSTKPGNLQKSFLELIAQLTDKDASDDKVTKKFKWEWWFPNQ